MSKAELEAKWQALSDQQDAMYANGDDLTDREMRILEIRNAALVWEMVKIEVEMGTQELDDDYINYKRAGERAARWLNNN